MATYTPKRLAGPAQLSTSATALYTATGDAVSKQITLNNTSSSPVTVTFHLVPVSASATAANAFISSISLAPYSNIIWTGDLPMVSGEKISALASTGSVVTYTVSGIEIS